MNLLGAVLYDPGTAVTKGAAASVMAAFDTTNARILFTVPPSGRVRVLIGTTLHGATTYSQIMLGVMEGSTIKGRIVPQSVQNGTALATTMLSVRGDFIVPGLTPGAALTWDAAWAIETFVTASLIKYGGPNDTTANNAFGALQFEIWDPSPAYAPAANGVPPTTSIHSKVDTLTTNVAAVQADTDNLQTRIPAALVGGRIDASVGAMAADVLTASALAADAGTEIGTAVWATTTRLLTAGTNIVLAKGTGVTGLNDLSAAQVNTECDTAIADAALLTAAGYIAPDNAAITAIKAKTDSLNFTVAGRVDSNTCCIAGVTVGGSGTPGTPWGPA